MTSLRGVTVSLVLCLVVSLMLIGRINADTDCIYGCEAMHLHARMGFLNEDTLMCYLNKGIDINCRDEEGETTVLWWAVTTPIAEPAVVQMLIDHGVDVNVRDGKGRTALNHAEFERDNAEAEEQRRKFDRIIQILKDAGGTR